MPIHTHHGLHHIYFSARPRHLNPGDQQGIRPRNKILAASGKDIPAPVVYAEKSYDYHVCRSGKPVSKALYRIFPPEVRKVLKKRAKRARKVFGFIKTGTKYLLAPIVGKAIPDHLSEFRISVNLDKYSDMSPRSGNTLKDYSLVKIVRHLEWLYREVEVENRELVSIESASLSGPWSEAIPENLKGKKSEITKLERHIQNIYEALYEEGLEDFACVGENPDHRVYLPVNDSGSGLSTQAMLSEMVKIVEEPHLFGLLTKNCSSIAARILAAGCQDHRFASIKKDLHQLVDAPEEAYARRLWTPRVLNKQAKKINAATELRPFWKRTLDFFKRLFSSRINIKNGTSTIQSADKQDLLELIQMMHLAMDNIQPVKDMLLAIGRDKTAIKEALVLEQAKNFSDPRIIEALSNSLDASYSRVGPISASDLPEDEPVVEKTQASKPTTEVTSQVSLRHKK